MNLDDLISEYLDSELSEINDAELRQILADDPIARQKFDDSVNLHIAFREDAERISVPDTLLRNTEDLVLMRVLNSNNDKVKKLYNYKRIPAFSTLVAAILIFTIFEISDLSTNKYLKPILNDNSKVISMAQTNSSETKTTNNKPLKNRITKIHNSKPINSSNNISLTSNIDNNNNDLDTELNQADKNEKILTENSSISNINSSRIESEQINTDINKQSMLYSEYFNSSSNISQVIENNITNNYSQNNYMQEIIPRFKNNYNTVLFNIYDTRPPINEIQFTTFFGTNVLTNGFDKTTNLKISNYSQSIGYVLAEKNIIGVDLGMTECGFDDKIEVRMPFSTATSGIEALDENNGFSSSNNYSYISVPFVFSRNKQQFWASVYYEQVLLDRWGANINGRVAFGGSPDGPLGYLRFFGKYNVLYGLSVTLGAEARGFMFNIPELRNANNDFKSTVSIIYGFQYSF